MAEDVETPNESTSKSSTEGSKSKDATVKLSGIFAFKEGMATVYNDRGEAVPVTVLRYEPWFVSQVKTKDADGYAAVQIACGPKKAKNAGQAESGHVKRAGFENGARLVREVRQSCDGIEVGQRVAIESLNKSDIVMLTGTSKGRGFAGSVKRFNFGGGPAAHGSKFHRQPGSSGNRTWPGRVMPGKRFPGHYGNETVSVSRVEIFDVLPEESVVLVKGPVPGARNSLVRLQKNKNLSQE